MKEEERPDRDFLDKVSNLLLFVLCFQVKNIKALYAVVIKLRRFEQSVLRNIR